jgi:hypothetical protein
MSPELFLAEYITENVGPLGAVGRFPLGVAGIAAGVPGIGPGFSIDRPDPNPGMFGGLLGLGAQKLFS